MTMPYGSGGPLRDDHVICPKCAKARIAELEALADRARVALINLLDDGDGTDRKQALRVVDDLDAAAKR